MLYPITALVCFLIGFFLTTLLVTDARLIALAKVKHGKTKFVVADGALTAFVAILAATWKLNEFTTTSSFVLQRFSEVVMGFLCVGIVVGIKYLSAKTTDLEKTAIAALEIENDNISHSRDLLVETGQFVDEILKEKYSRLTALAVKENLTAADLISVDSTRRQIVIIIQAIHEFFEQQLSKGRSLRLGIYFRSDTVPDTLELAYSWNGKTEQCFSNKSADYLKIVRTNNIMSELGKCYNSDEGMIIVSSCEEGVKNGAFAYLRAEQATWIKSLLVYRFQVVSENNHPWIIYLDSDEPGFFDVTKKTDYGLFLDSLTKRISFELVTLDLKTKLTPSPTT